MYTKNYKMSCLPGVTWWSAERKRRKKNRLQRRNSSKCQAVNTKNANTAQLFSVSNSTAATIIK